MALLDRSPTHDVGVRLQRHQEPMGLGEMVLAVFLGMWLFVISLWIVGSLLAGAVLSRITDFVGG